MTYIKAVRGDDEEYDITLVDEAGQPLDLDDLDEMWFTVHDTDNSDLLQKTRTGGGIVVTDAAAGEATISITPADTEDLPSRALSLAYDVQVRDSTGVISTPIRGRLRVSPDVTTAIV